MDRMRRYRERTRTVSPATILHDTVSRYVEPIPFLPFSTDGRSVQVEYSPDAVPLWPYRDPGEDAVGIDRERVEELLREMGATTIEWKTPHSGIVSA